MVEDLKLYGSELSPFVLGVKIVLNMKGITYENMEEDLNNKSVDLIKYNPVHKKVPVLVHNGNPISESLVIAKYIEDVWKGVPILPQDPYEKAIARFWVKFIHDKCLPSIFKVFGNVGDKQAMAEAYEQLQILEIELTVKGTKFFGGDDINLIDIAGNFIAYWLGMIEELTEIKILAEDKYPKITEWADNFVKCEVVEKLLPTKVFPPKEYVLAIFKKAYGKV